MRSAFLQLHPGELDMPQILISLKEMHTGVVMVTHAAASCPKWTTL